MLAIASPTPVLALARGDVDLGLVYVERPPWPQLAHFQFQRLGTDGVARGAPIAMSPVDMSVPGTVSVVFDGSAYFACTIIVGGASCFRVDAAGSTEGPMVLDATAIAIAQGAGGPIGAWIAGGALNVGPLEAPTGVVATTDAAPSIATAGAGYVVGYTAGATAFVVTLDAAGHADAPIALGPARAAVPVAVAASGALLAASWVSDAGDATVALVTRGAPVVAHLGPGARTAIAPAADGFFATWSAVGAIHGAFVDPRGTITSTPIAHDVGQDDAAHALVALPDALVLATDTTSPTAPIDVAIVSCL